MDDVEEVALSAPDISLLKKILGDGAEARRKGILTVDGQDSLLYKSKFTFEQFNLKPEVLRGVYACSYNTPSLIQGAVLKLFRNKEGPVDLIVQSQNGTGKTAAFALCILEKIDCAKGWPQCVVVVPTYELGLQVIDVIKQLGNYVKNLGIYSALRHDVSETHTYENVTEPIVVGTPGKLNYLINVSGYVDISRLEMLIIDEADVLMDTGNLGPQVKKIMQNLPRKSSVFFFTATLDDRTLAVARLLTKDAALIRLRNHELSLPNLHQYYVMCENDKDKFDTIMDVYKTLIIGQCIIFCATRISAHSLAKKLQNVGFTVLLLTGDLTIAERAKAIKEFRSGVVKVLIATNVCARGIDIAYVNLVVNYNLPMLPNGQPDYPSYLHRIGRGGRFGVSGVALTLVTTEDEVRVIENISNYYGNVIQYLPRENLHTLENVVQPEF